jgi:hypothetical protein
MCLAPRRLAGQASPVLGDKGVDPVERPRETRHFPGQRRPRGISSHSECEPHRSRAADLPDFRPAVQRVQDCPGSSVSFGVGHAGSGLNAVLLRRHDLESVAVSEAPDPPGTTRAEASMPVEDERRTVRPRLRKLTEIHGNSVPAMR